MKKEKYVSKPSIKKIQRAYRKTNDSEVVKEISNIYERKEAAYKKQKAEILTGEKPSKAKDVASKIIKATLKGFSKGIKPSFKKPKFKPIKKLSATRLIQQMGSESGALVKEVEKPYVNPEQDNRSLFFKEEYKNEKRKSFGGFI